MKTARSFCALSYLGALVSLMFQSCLWTPRPCPQVLDFNPLGGAAGEVITITGDDFCAGRPDLNIVKIGDVIVPEADVTVVSAQEIRFKVPLGAGDGQISVTLKDECPAVSSEEFTYYYTATTVKTLIGIPNDNLCDACLNEPAGLTVDESGNIIVADAGNNMVRIFNFSGVPIQSFGRKQHGCDPTPTFAPSFYTPADVAVGLGVIYVADLDNNVIRKINSDNNISIYAGKCNMSNNYPLEADGSCINSEGPALIGIPRSLVKDGNEVYLADKGNIRKIDDPCNIRTLLEHIEDVQDFNAITFSHARSDGPLFFTDKVEKNVKSLGTSGGIPKVVPMDTNLLIRPVDLAIDYKGSIFIADTARQQILVIYKDNVIKVLAGTGIRGYTNDMVPGREAQFRAPTGLALDPNRPNILYVSDKNNHVIRRLTLE